MTYSVALVGCGRMGYGYDVGRNFELDDIRQTPYTHAAAVSLHDAFMLTAIADPVAQQRIACAEQWHVPNVFTDAESLFRSLTPDVLILATPSTVRLSVIELALKSGVKAIVCEKPLALTTDIAQSIIRACDGFGVPLMVNFSRRWDTAAQTVAKQIKSFGQVEAFHGYYVNGIANNGAHLLDLINWWADDTSEVIRVQGDERSPQVTLRLAGGGLGTLTPVNSFDIFELDFLMSGGRVILRESGYDIRLHRLQAPSQLSRLPILMPPEQLVSGLDKALMRMLDNLADILANHAQPNCDGNAGLAVTSILAQVKQHQSH